MADPGRDHLISTPRDYTLAYIARADSAINKINGGNSTDFADRLSV